MRIESIGSSSKGNCHYVDVAGTKILLDAGLSVREIQKELGFITSAIDGVLLTHSHKDHSRAIKDLVRMGVDVYASVETLTEIGIRTHRTHIVKADEWFRLGAVNVLPLEMIHDVETYGYVVDGNGERLLYITDTQYCRFNVKGVTHLIVECNYCNELLRAGDANDALKMRIRKSHTSLQTVEKMLNDMDKSRLQHVYLTHLSDNHSDERLFRERVQRLTGVEVDVFSA